MITITRRLAMQIRTVFRRALDLSCHGNCPPLTFETGPDGLKIRTANNRAAAECRLPGDHSPGRIALPFEFLADCEARRDDPVQLQIEGDGQIVAQWRDDNVPQMTRYNTVKSEESSKTPDFPADFVDNPSVLLKALHHAMETADLEAVRYSTDHIQLKGADGKIAATDGHQLLVQNGFEFPWEENVLVSRTKVFGSRELPQDEPVAIGKTDKWLCVRVGPWTIFRQINVDGQFPEVEHHIPEAAGAAARFQLASADAESLKKNVSRLPSDDELNLPVTVDLNGSVVIRAKAKRQKQPTELVLSDATLSGDPMRFNTNRRFLVRAADLGFREVCLFSAESPALCHDERRRYVWALLDPKSAIGPTDDAIRITAPNGNNPTQTSSSTSRKRRTTMNKPASRQDGQTDREDHTQTTNGGKSDQSPVGTLIAQAEAVKTSLKEALTKTGELISGLKRHQKQSKTVQAALASLRQLENIDT